MSPSLPAHRWPSLGLLGLIQLYKWTLSPIIGRDCRYLPTCSSYAADAIRAHGAWAGGWMATARICRCHPWGGQGYDPVPGTDPAHDAQQDTQLTNPAPQPKDPA